MASSSSSYFLLFAAILAASSWQAMASDPSPLQDFCVADNSSRGMSLILASVHIRILSCVKYVNLMLILLIQC
jgi:hypothetical protein